MRVDLTTEMIHALRVSPDLLLDFFVLFSRFEYALKAADFRQDAPNQADVSWDKFKNWLTQLPTIEQTAVENAGRYLIDNPPKKLVVLNGVSSWQVPGRGGQSGVRFLVEGLGRARNNLFHGGKWLTPPELPERNFQVVSTALDVLRALVALPSALNLRRHFEELPSSNA